MRAARPPVKSSVGKAPGEGKEEKKEAKIKIRLCFGFDGTWTGRNSFSTVSSKFYQSLQTNSAHAYHKAVFKSDLDKLLEEGLEEKTNESMRPKAGALEALIAILELASEEVKIDFNFNTNNRFEYVEACLWIALRSKGKEEYLDRINIMATGDGLSKRLRIANRCRNKGPADVTILSDDELAQLVDMARGVQESDPHSQRIPYKGEDLNWTNILTRVKAEIEKQKQAFASAGRVSVPAKMMPEHKAGPEVLSSTSPVGSSPAALGSATSATPSTASSSSTTPSSFLTIFDARRLIFQYHQAMGTEGEPTASAKSQPCEVYFELACVYEKQGEFEQAIKYYDRAAAAGHSVAQFKLGSYYELGKVCRKDEISALQWYLLAANQDYPKAAYNVACCYLNAIGTEKDVGKAKNWYLKAAQLGDPDAQCFLGKCYQEGHELVNRRVNKKKALQWFEKAAKQGVPAARYQVARSCEEKEDFARAVNYYSLVKGYGDTNERLGVVDEKLKVINRAKNMAFINTIIRAAEAGDPEAQKKMGDYYTMDIEELTGIIRDDKKAVEWYKKAAEQEYVPAQKALAQCYEKGIGTTQDKDKAFELYNLVGLIEGKAEYNGKPSIATAVSSQTTSEKLSSGRVPDELLTPTASISTASRRSTSSGTVHESSTVSSSSTTSMGLSTSSRAAHGESSTGASSEWKSAYGFNFERMLRQEPTPEGKGEAKPSVEPEQPKREGTEQKRAPKTAPKRAPKTAPKTENASSFEVKINAHFSSIQGRIPVLTQITPGRQAESLSSSFSTESSSSAASTSTGSSSVAPRRTTSGSSSSIIPGVTTFPPPKRRSAAKGASISGSSPASSTTSSVSSSSSATPRV